MRTRPRHVAMAALAALSLLSTATVVDVAGAAVSSSVGARAGGSLNLLQVNLAWSSMDPNQPTSTASFTATFLAYQNLLTLNTDGQLEPMLATSWSYNAAHTVLTLDLRHGVKFQDGTPFNAAAVVYDLERVSLPPSTSECPPYFTTVSAITAVNPYKVAISFSSPYSPLIEILAGEPCTAIASPTAIQQLGVAAFAEHPVGTSPWAYSSSVLDSSITYTRFKGAWQKAYLNSITVSTIGDDQSAIDAVETGTAQVFNAAGAVQDIPLIKAAKDVKLLKTPPQSVADIRLALNKPPFNNSYARRALAQAIDTPLLARELYSNQLQWTQGIETPVDFAFTGNRIRGYPQYSPAQATSDVAAFPGGKLSFTMITTNTPTAIQLGEAVQSELQAIPGMTVLLTPVSQTAFLAALHGQTFQAVLSPPGGGTVFPDPDLSFDRNFCFCNGTNAGDQDGYDNPAYDSLVLEARQTFSQPQRRALYVRAQEILAKDLPWIALFNGPQVWAVNKKVHDWPPIDSINASGLAGAWLS